MSKPDGNDPATPAPVDEDRLARLGREWFAAARATSERENTEFAAWDRERRKWTDVGGSSDGWLSGGDGDGGGD
jgi:hypothetical protein